MRFKEYIQDQRMLFPPSFYDFIPTNDPVRIISSAVDSVDISSVLKTYHDKGFLPIILRCC